MLGWLFKKKKPRRYVTDKLDINIKAESLTKAREKKINDAFGYLIELAERFDCQFAVFEETTFSLCNTYKERNGEQFGMLNAVEDTQSVAVTFDLSLEIIDDVTANGKETVDAEFTFEFMVEVETDDGYDEIINVEKYEATTAVAKRAVESALKQLKTVCEKHQLKQLIH